MRSTSSIGRCDSAFASRADPRELPNGQLYPNAQLQQYSYNVHIGTAIVECELRLDWCTAGHANAPAVASSVAEYGRGYPLAGILRVIHKGL